MRALVVFLAVLFIFGMNNIGNAECTSECLQYCGPSGSHGYCVDYVRSRLGVAQTKDAGSWIGNINFGEVRADDVAIFAPTSSNPYGHVAVVDSVDGNNITVSEWNYGSVMVNSSCGVTDNYGIKTTRTIPGSSVSRFWRPNSNSDTYQVQVEVRTAGNIGWYPPNKSCISAERWYRVEDVNGTKQITQMFQNGNICLGINYIGLGIWYDVIFGNNDLAQMCGQ